MWTTHTDLTSAKISQTQHFTNYLLNKLWTTHRFDHCKHFSNTTFHKQFFLLNCVQLTQIWPVQKFLKHNISQTLFPIQMWTTHTDLTSAKISQTQHFTNYLLNNLWTTHLTSAKISQTQHFTDTSSYSTVDNSHIWQLQKFIKHNYSQMLLPIQLWTTHRFDHCKHFSNTTFHKHFFLLNCEHLTDLTSAKISQTQHFTKLLPIQLWTTHRFDHCKH